MSRTVTTAHRMVNAPSRDQYISAFQRIADDLSDLQRSILIEHYRLKRASPEELALSVGKKSWNNINRSHSLVGELLCKQALVARPIVQEPYQDDKHPHWWSILATYYFSGKGGVFEIRPELEQALESIGWVSPSNALSTSSENPNSRQEAAAPNASDIVPPARIPTTTYRILRDTALARRVKRIHNWECQICGHFIAFADGSRYAEAHHIRPLGEPHNGPDDEANVLCVCPNHHAELDYGVLRIDDSTLRRSEGHVIDPIYVKYHNDAIFGRL